MSYIQGVTSGTFMDVVADGKRGKVQTFPELASAARRTSRGAFWIPGNPTNMASTNSLCQLYILNANNAKNIVITRIFLNADLAGMFMIKTDITYSSGGSAIIPVNTYVGSTDSLGATCLEGEAGTELATTGGNAGPSIYCPAAGQIFVDFLDALILPYNKAIGVFFAGAAGSEIISILAMAYTEVES
jgi:hypothetical protein